MKLRPQRRLDAFAGFIAGPQRVTKRFDDMIGRDADMRRALFDQFQHRMQHTIGCAERFVLPFVEAAQAIEMTEQLVGAVDEVDDHGFARGELHE